MGSINCVRKSITPIVSRDIFSTYVKQIDKITANFVDQIIRKHI